MTTVFCLTEIDRFVIAFSAFSLCSARMENGVLGNALEGVHVEEEEGEKTEESSLVENNDNIDGMWNCMWHPRDVTFILVYK